MRRRWQIGLLSMLFLVVWGPAAAEGSVGGYVSDQFMKMAKRLVRHYAAEAIKQACPADFPLCQPLAVNVAKAAGAALEGNAAAAKQALRDFFADSAVAIMLQQTIGDLTHAERLAAPGHSAAELKTLKKLSLWSGRLMGCLAGQLMSADTQCDIDGIVADLEADLKGYAKGSVDETPLATSLDSLKNGNRPTVGDALTLLQVIASSDLVSRPDIRIYLEEFKDFFSQDPRDGLFQAGHAWLTARKPSQKAEFLINFESARESALWVADADVRESLQKCGSGSAALEHWSDFVRQRGSYHQELRNALLTGAAPRLDPLLRLTALGECVRGDPATQDELRSLRRAIWYAATPLRVDAAVARFGTVALAGAALIDYARSGDDQQLRDNLLQTWLYGLAQIYATAKNTAALQEETLPAAKKLTADRFATAPKILESCEFRAVAVHLAIGQKRGPCQDLQGADGTVSAVSDAHAFNQALNAVKSAMDTVAPTLGQQWQACKELLEALLAGRVDVKDAGRRLLRLGIDLLVERIDDFAQDLIGGDESVCQATGWRHLGYTRALCALRVLIEGAYRPIAEYFLAQDPDKKGDATALARKVYQGLIHTGLLQYTPLILNVGLGGTYVIGKHAVWGEHGYAAGTLLDKVGLAFSKYQGTSCSFEWGLFAGGFLDALARTAAQEGEDARSWLLGLTAGFPRMGGWDLGFEFHAAAAMPFDLRSREHYGLAVGAALIIPFDVYLTASEGKDE